jgi:penicillin G amidase
MPLPDHEILRRLGSGQSFDSVRADAGLTADAFATWWSKQLRDCVPANTGVRRCGVRRSVTIRRDAWGIPHIHADNDPDLFFGFGHAMAQDRLWQLDFFRRKGAGRLAEILGPRSGELDFLVRMVGVPSVLEWDLLARTVGIRRIAEKEWPQLNAETRTLLQAFSDGVNAQIQEIGDALPIEFSLLDYRPEPWTPIDCLTIEGDFRWYLTGRFPVIVMPELVRRKLGDGPFYQAFQQAESDEESILHPGDYPLTRPAGIPAQKVGASLGSGDATGSNNWVVSGRWTEGGKPLVASDPHVPFDAVSWWYEVHLCGGSFHVAGMAYAGMPAVMFGRTERVAWGCTNNICSQRDLYQEKTDPQHPGCFLHDGVWEPARELEEVIQVKGAVPVTKTVRFSRNGPLVDEVLPPAARQTGPVSLKWLGSYEGGWLTALLGMDRARSAAELQEAMRPWHVPTFSVVYADVEGHIGYQAVGRIPIRNIWERGYRPGWDPQHQWQGLIPYEGMPQTLDPKRGWVVTANHRPAPDDFPYPLSGTWGDAYRAVRIRQLLEAGRKATVDRFRDIQQDAMSLRAVRVLPDLLAALAGDASPHIQEAAGLLSDWDGQMEVDRVGATIFEVFFSRWVRRVLRERFDGDVAGLLAGSGTSLAAGLLQGDPLDWFQRGEPALEIRDTQGYLLGRLNSGDRETAIRETMNEALEYLTKRLGPNMGTWQWGRIHLLPLRHVLSGFGDLGKLLDQGGLPVKGNAYTVCNTGLGGQFEARSGPGYRLISDLGSEPPTLLAVSGESQSGHPGSPHYSDQLTPWLEGGYHALVLDRSAAPEQGEQLLTLEPSAPNGRGS